MSSSSKGNVEIHRQEFNDMVARITAVERSSDVHEIRIAQTGGQIQDIHKSLSHLEEVIQRQGLRLALVFGGISVIVTGAGLSVAFLTMIEKITAIVAK